MRLGRLPHSPAALAAAPRHYAATPPPPVLDRSAVRFEPGMYSNDVLPCCVAAALANAARGAAWASTGGDIVVVPDKVDAAYARWAGCSDTMPAMEATDGVAMLPAYEDASSNGFDVGQQVPLVPIWGVVDPSDRMTLAHAMTLGPALLGVTLLQSDEETLGQIWDINVGNQKVAGGHALIAWDYTGLGDSDTVRLGTWAAWQRATWRWVRARADEAFAVSWPQITSAPA